MNSVKQERYDEAEIQELVAKFVEANNKAKMAAPQRPQNAAQNMNILSFLHSADKKKQQPPANNDSNASTTKNIDEDSVKGRFGWTTMGKVHIPFIYRNDEHYCAVRMVESKVLNKLLTYLHQDIYNCTNIRSYYITEAEARLLNEINFKHCDYQFGRDHFTTRDLIVRLQDAREFHKFLSHCYNKLVNTVDSESLDRCGFIRINRESVVPYTVYNDQKYVPLFYFEGETDNLKQRADKLEGWDLSYLKFCCKVQGIRNELFAHDSCSVISLNDIKNYFPPGTSFEDYWPKKNLDSQLLITSSSRAQPAIQWTRQPIAPPVPSHPPPSPKPATQAKAANNSSMHNVHVYSNYAMASAAGGGQPPYHAPQPRTATAAARATYPAASSARQHLRPSTSYYTSMAQAPPPLVRAQTYPTYGKDDWQSASYPNSQAPVAPSNYMLIDSNLPQNNYHTAASQLNKYPPPLMHMNGGLSSRYDGPTRYAGDPVDLNTPNRDLSNSYGVNSSGQAQIINQQPAHQQPTSRSTPSSLTGDDRNSLTNGRMTSSMSNMNRPKLTSIPDPPTSGSHIPYKIQKVLVDGEMLPCINMKPYVTTDLLVTLPDLISNFFKNVSVQACQQVMQVLGIELYKPNNSQMRVLMENGKCQNINDTVPLVQVRNVMNYMPQLKYMLNITPELAAKRQRNS